MKKFQDTDPRSWWKPAYKLAREYPGMKKIGLEISDKGYTKNGVIPIVDNPEEWPYFWNKINSPDNTEIYS